MYAVMGASGNTGHVVAEQLLAAGKSVRVIGRAAAKLQAFVDRGAETAIGDVGDGQFLARAFAGADAVYALTPFDMSPPDYRAYQNRMGQALVEGLRDAGVKHVVHLSSLGADKDQGTGPVLGLHDLEQRMDALDGVNILHLRPTYFMENLLANIPVIKQMGVHGSPLRGDIAFPLIATPDIGAFAAERLLRLDFSGKQVQELLGPRDYTLNEITPVLGAAIGRPELPYVQFPYEAAEQGMIGAGMSPDLAAKMVELNRAINDGYAITGGLSRTAANTTPTTIEQFAPVFAYVYTMG